LPAFFIATFSDPFRRLVLAKPLNSKRDNKEVALAHPQPEVPGLQTHEPGL